MKDTRRDLHISIESKAFIIIHFSQMLSNLIELEDVSIYIFTDPTPATESGVFF